MLRTLLRKLRSAPVLLGRWCRTEKNMNDLKVDLANIDHCGVCMLDKDKIKKVIVPKNKKIATDTQTK